MGEQPLIVVLLWLPVTAMKFLSRVLATVLGTACFLAFSGLHVCLSGLMVRSSVLAMVVTGLVRGAILLAFVSAAAYAMFWQLQLVLQEDISLWISLPTDILALLILLALTIKGMQGRQVQDFRPFVVISIRDFVAAILTLVALASGIGWIRLYRMPKAVMTYHDAILREVASTGADVVCVLIALPMLVLPWRLYWKKTELLEKSALERIPLLLLQLLNTLADVLFLLPLLLVVFTGYRLPELLRTLDRLPVSSWRHEIICSAGSVLLDLPFVLMGLIVLVCGIRSQALIYELLKRMGLSNQNVFQRMLLRLRPDLRTVNDSLRTTILLSFIEMLAMPILLLELAVLQVTVYRFPHEYRNILFHPGPLEVFAHINSEFGALLLDVPFLVLLVLLLPFVWRSAGILRGLYHRSVSRRSIADALLFSILDFFLLVAIALIYGTIIRIGFFHRLYRQRARQHFSDRIYGCTLEAIGQLPLDLLHLPLVVLLPFVLWRLPSIYLRVDGENSPYRQRDIFRNELVKGLRELAHVVILLPFAIITPWQLLSLRNFLRIKDVDSCEAIRMTVAVAVLDIPFLLLLLLACVVPVSVPSAFSAFFASVKGATKSDVSQYKRSRQLALVYYGAIGLCSVLSLLGLLVISVTMWRLPTIVYVVRHPKEVKKQFEERLGVSGGKEEKANPLLVRSHMQEAFVGASLVLFLEWLKDLPYLPLALITPPWRLYKWGQEVWTADFALSRQKDHRRALMWSSRTGCLDVLSVLASVVLIATLWRLVFFHKLLKKNAHLGYEKSTKTKEYLSYHYCVLITFREWVKDLPFVPLGLLICVFAFWRIPPIVRILMGQAERIPTIKDYKSIASERKKLLRMFLSVVLFDYPAMLMTIVLIGTVWRSVITVNLLKLHFMKHFVSADEEVDFTLFREITAQFLQLCIDFLEVIMMLTVLLLGMHAKDLIRRVRTFTRLYKERKGFYSLKVVQSWCPKAAPPRPETRGLASMSKNILYEVSTLLDLRDVGRLQQTCRYLRAALEPRPVWYFQYTHNYSKFIEKALYSEVVHAEYNYKRLAVEGYLEYKKAHVGEMSEEDRDYKLGLRAVVLEEFVMTFLNLPHLIALPAKGLSFTLYYLPYSWYISQPGLFFRRQFQVRLRNIAQSTFDSFQSIAQNILTEYKPEYQWDFYHVQINLLFQLLLLAMGVLEVLTWATVHADLVMIKLLSGWRHYPLHAPIPPRPLPPPAGLRVLQVLQVFWMLAHVVIRTALAVAPFALCLLYSSYSVIGCVVGPFFLNIFWYVLIYANLSTLYQLLNHFPYYAPLTNIQAIGTIAGHRTYNFSSFVFGMVSRALTRVYAAIVIGTTDCLSAVARALQSSSSGLLRKYSSVLFTAGGILKPYGLLGDLLFTPLTLVWMLWPLLVAYMLGKSYYFVPGGLVSLVLVVKGYKTAQLAWRG